MTETLTIVDTITITITLLAVLLVILLAMLTIYLLVRERYGANAFIHPRAGDKLSMLNRRRKAFRLATKEWHGKLDRGYPTLAGDCKRSVDHLEREVAALENALFGTKEEAISKLKATRSKPILSVEYVDGEIYYSSECATCEWSAASTSKEVAVKIYVEHEGTHA